MGCGVFGAAHDARSYCLHHEVILNVYFVTLLNAVVPETNLVGLYTKRDWRFSLMIC